MWLDAPKAMRWRADCTRSSARWPGNVGKTQNNSIFERKGSIAGHCLVADVSVAADWTSRGSGILCG